jgi:hypothetical protein
LLVLDGHDIRAVVSITLVFRLSYASTPSDVLIYRVLAVTFLDVIVIILNTRKAATKCSSARGPWLVILVCIQTKCLFRVLCSLLRNDGVC